MSFTRDLLAAWGRVVHVGEGVDRGILAHADKYKRPSYPQLKLEQATLRKKYPPRSALTTRP